MSGPLAPFAEEYRLELMARGYTVRSAVNELRQVARLSRWLEDGGLGARDLSRKQIEEFLAFQRRSGRLRSQSRPGLLCLLGVLQARGVAVEPPAGAAFGERAAALSFERYLLAERGLAAGTVAGYLAHAGRFLDGLPAGGLPAISAAEVSQAVLRVSASAAAATAQNFISGLRAFLGLLFLEGLAGRTSRRRLWRCNAGGRRFPAGWPGPRSRPSWTAAIAAARLAAATTRSWSCSVLSQDRLGQRLWQQAQHHERVRYRHVTLMQHGVRAPFGGDPELVRGGINPGHLGAAGVRSL
jgi:hypothetical protein